jgi:hypothetical protein
LEGLLAYALMPFVREECKMQPKLLLIAALLSLASSATYASTITVFNDFGPGNSYESFQAAPISGPDSEFGYLAFAMPFTSFNEVNVTQIDLGLGIIDQPPLSDPGGMLV